MNIAPDSRTMDTVHGRYTVDDVGRLYEVGSNKDLYPSVSTVLDVRDKPEKLKRWEQRTSAEEQERFKSYTQNRGTLVHANCQDDIIPVSPDSGEPIKQLWGEDEQTSEDELKANGEWERYQDDLEFIEYAWSLIKRILNLPPSVDEQSDESYNTVHDVETYVANKEIGYAGQFDLLYQDEDRNETVLADLKTSKGIYTKYQLQLAAYAMAVPMSIDRVEVIRMNPEKRDWDISSSHDWDRSLSELQEEFIDLRRQLEEEKLGTIVDTIEGVDKDDDDVMYETMG